MKPYDFSKIDWPALRNQKKDLMCLQDSIKTDAPDTFDNIEGIIELIDSIQDYAVEELGVPESDVFYTEGGENV